MPWPPWPPPKPCRLPGRIVHIVNAESLLNDASGLVAFKLAVAAAATGLFSSAEVAGNFVILAGGGMVVGIAFEWVGRQLRQRLIRLQAGDPVLQTLLTVLIPYGAYLAAEALQVSGILAVVAAGLWASGQEVKGLTADARRHAREVWRMLSYILNGLVFVLLGLQLRRMLTSVDHFAPLDLALYALVLWLLLMVLRIGWVWASAHVRFRLHWGWAGSRSGPDPKRMLLVSWAAVRGSITLATALSVPAFVAGGMPFPERDLVVFLAAATILLTLALNGVPLPWIIGKLALDHEEDAAREESAARAEIARAAIGAVALTAKGPFGPRGRVFRWHNWRTATKGSSNCSKVMPRILPCERRTSRCDGTCVWRRSTPSVSACTSCTLPMRSTTKRCGPSRPNSTSAS
jgi:NhaP-type Na+/H+ or K+/H+ antiporter